jgi:hypothetical protein
MGWTVHVHPDSMVPCTFLALSREFRARVDTLIHKYPPNADQGQSPLKRVSKVGTTLYDRSAGTKLLTTLEVSGLPMTMNQVLFGADSCRFARTYIPEGDVAIDGVDKLIRRMDRTTTRPVHGEQEMAGPENPGHLFRA